MAKKRRRQRGSAPADESGGPAPIVPRVIFSRDLLELRYFARPGANAPGSTPSRMAMVCIHAVIIGVIALCALGVILNLLHR